MATEGLTPASTWARWIERLLPPGLDEEGTDGSRFFIQGWTVITLFSLVQVVMYWLGGLWSQVLISLVWVGCGPVMLFAHRRRAPFRALVHLSLGISSLCLCLGTLAQRPADFSSLGVLMAAPLLGGLLLGARQALGWLVVSVALTALCSIAAEQGWVLDFADPTPTLSRVLNISVGLGVSWVVTLAFEGVRERGQRRSRELERARSAFLATVSHEIRTPMNGVLGMTEVMLQSAPSASSREQLRIIQRSGQTLVALINDLLDLSKMEAGKLQVEARDFNVDTVLSDVHALNAASAASKGLVLTVRKAEAVPARLHGDGLRLGQVLANLLSNAVKFTAQGTVCLEAARLTATDASRVRCRFTVTDTGVGIPPQVLPRLFSAFQQADSSTTRRFGGTGLGLALSQQLVNLMGGQIQVSSQPGIGTRFWFEVEFEASQEACSAPAVEAVRLVPADDWVLVVDDNPINLTVAMALVEKSGFKAEGATDGSRALEAMRRRDYALVLMDCHMPEMDGFEATERIRALPGAASRTPVVALTASAMPEEIAACHRAGMNSVLTKPLTFAALREVLEQHAA